MNKRWPAAIARRARRALRGRLAAPPPRAGPGLRAARRVDRGRLATSSCARPRRSRWRRSPTATTSSCSSTATRSSRRCSRRWPARKRSLNFLSYLYWSGEIGARSPTRCASARRRGVEVNVLLDAVGSAKMDRELIRDMDDAGVNFAYFRPPKPYAIRRVNNRTHRKLLIVDGKVGMTGGVGHRRPVDRQRAGPRPLARHARARPRADRARPAGRLRRELAGGDRRRARRARTTCPSSSRSPTTARCRSCARRRRSATRTSRRCTSWRSPARARRCISRRRTSRRGRRSSRR